MDRSDEDVCPPKSMRALKNTGRDLRRVVFFALAAVGAAVQLYWGLSGALSSSLPPRFLGGEHDDLLLRAADADGPRPAVDDRAVGVPESSPGGGGGGDDDDRSRNHRPRSTVHRSALGQTNGTVDGGKIGPAKGGGVASSKGASVVKQATPPPPNAAEAGRTPQLRAGGSSTPVEKKNKRMRFTADAPGAKRKRAGFKDLILAGAERWVAERAAAREAAGEPPDPYPEHTAVGQFETAAAKEEARRHDRLIVEGMAYVASLTEDDLREWDLGPDAPPPSTLCINVMTSERKIPYVNALVMMLMRGQSPKRLLEYAKINVMNMERRPGHMEYRLVGERLSRLPFLDVRNITKEYPADPATPFHVIQRTNTIAGFDLCIESKLPFCLLIEDDAVTPMNFIDSFDTFVRPEMERAGFAGSSVSLHSYHSYFASRTQVDLRAEYHAPNGTYEHEVSKTNARLRHLGQPAYAPSFELVNAKVKFGTVANVYTLEMAKRFRDYLVEFDDEESLAFPDVLMFNSKYFGKKVGLTDTRRMQIEPSLVNHIGFYSEINKGKSFKASDVRFQLDAGE